MQRALREVDGELHVTRRIARAHPFTVLAEFVFRDAVFGMREQRRGDRQTLGLQRGEAAQGFATGRIDASGLEALRAHGIYRSWRTVFRSRIVYSYSVAGQNYTADRVTFGANVTASLPGLVSGQARRYVEGSKVDVHYDPANPASAVLECRVRGLWVLWVCSLGFLGAAAWLVGLV